jgi:hypothetical protein
MTRAHTCRIPEAEGFLSVRDFLDTISEKLSPAWGSQQLAEIIVAKELAKTTHMPDQSDMIQILGPAFCFLK